MLRFLSSRFVALATLLAALGLVPAAGGETGALPGPRAVADASSTSVDKKNDEQEDREKKLKKRFVTAPPPDNPRPRQAIRAEAAPMVFLGVGGE